MIDNGRPIARFTALCLSVERVMGVARRPSLRRAPNQGAAGGHLLNAKIDSSLLIGEQRRLRRDYVQVRIDSQLVAILGEREGFVARTYCTVLDLQFPRTGFAATRGSSSTCWKAVSTAWR